jgi:hypothetical protein
VILASNRHGVQISTKTLIEGTLDAFEFQEHEGLIHVAIIRITHNCKVEVQNMRVDLRSKAGVKTH